MLFRSNPVTKVYGYVGYNEGSQEIVISFRGSDNIANWIVDLDAVQVPFGDYPGVLVHAGFNAGYSGVQAQVTKAVKTILSQNCPSCTNAICTGHSLGAALAGFCAMDMAINMELNTSLINFGMPRIGNEAFATLWTQHVKGVSWRFVHRHDIVPHLPLRNMGPDGDFHHVPTEVTLHNQPL